MVELRARNEDIHASCQLSHSLGLRKTFDFFIFNFFSHKYSMGIMLAFGRETLLLLVLVLVLVLPLLAEEEDEPGDAPGTIGVGCLCSPRTG